MSIHLDARFAVIVAAVRTMAQITHGSSPLALTRLSYLLAPFAPKSMEQVQASRI